MKLRENPKQFKLSDVKLIELEPEAMTNNFIANKLPVIVNYDPQALRAEREGNGVLAATSATYAGVIPEGFAARPDVASKISPEDLQKFFKGWLKAIDWSKDAANWDGYKKILNEKTFEVETPYSDEDLKGMLASVKIHDKADLLEANKNQGGLEQYLESLKTFLKENNMLNQDYQTKDLLMNEAFLKAIE
ncbi:MAG: ABC transporter substrate-binding protein [Gammaproteobacteria bacterium]